MKKIKQKFKNFWNNNHVSDWEWEHYNSEDRRQKYPGALPPIGFRDWILSFIIAILLVSILIYFM